MIRQNSSNRKNNNSLIGATYCKLTNRWRAEIRVNSKKIWLGRFDTELQAHQSYIDARDYYDSSIAVAKN